MNGILSYVGIGSNLGDPLKQCREGIQRISSAAGIQLERVSSFYKTEPVYAREDQGQNQEDQSWFINAVAEIRTVLFPMGLLKSLQEIEQAMGRKRLFKDAPRTIDLDLLLYDQEIIAEDNLIVPHPQMHKRRFVLEPMCEIASYVIHPTYGISMKGLKDRIDDLKIVERLI